MAEAARAIPNDRDRVHHGVTFEAWAFVLAGLGDGLPEDELLACLGITGERWQLANAAFQEDILDDVEAGGTLTEAFDEAMHAAWTRWSRRIPPLDTDLRAWLDFYRAWTAAESPMDFLEAQRLRATDIHRLQDLWLGRLAEDAALRAAASTILQEPPGPVPTVEPEAARLVVVAAATTETRDVTGAAARGPRVSLPFTDGEPAPVHPRLSVPLPLSTKLAERAGADRTRVVGRAETGGVVLPFLAPEDVILDPEPSPTAPEPRHDDGERVPLSIERYAALCVDFIEAPDAHGPILMRYGITAAEKLALDVHWTQKMAEDTTIWLAWERACAARRAEAHGDGEAMNE